MRKDVKFLALGGAQSIGASCYLLKLGNNNILLDCGALSNGGYIRGPNLLALFKKGGLQSIKELSAVFISHAHLDHMGYLPQLLAEYPEVPVYMTQITEMLIRYQVFNNENIAGLAGMYRASGEGRLLINTLLDNIHKVSYMETRVLKDYAVTFYPAGHMPGAMMVMFRYMGRNILYTGDYSFKDTVLSHACILPTIRIDTMIMCGTHAKHPWYRRENNVLTKSAEKILNLARDGKNIFCRINQLSKGVELLAELNRLRELYKFKVPIYIDNSIMNIIINLERANISILREGNHILSFGKKPIPHITIVQGKAEAADANETAVNVDFALHDDFEEMKSFIQYVNPSKAVVVHCGETESYDTETIEDQLVWDPKCKTQFFFPDENQLLQL